MRAAIGYAPQRFAFDREFPITVREFLDLARRPHCPVGRIAEKINEVGLPRTILDRRLGTLSGGELQKILLAQAILNNPAILFLDEPSAGVDVAGEQTLYEIIAHLNREHHTTVIMVSHDLAVVARLVDRVICVNRQLLCYGSPKEALTERPDTTVRSGHSSNIKTSCGDQVMERISPGTPIEPNYTCSIY